MTRARYVNLTMHVGSVSVPAYDTSKPGIVVHRDYHHWSFWNVTHEPSGEVIGFDFLARKNALAFVEELPGVDWTLSKELLYEACLDILFGAKEVRELEKKYGGKML